MPLLAHSFLKILIGSGGYGGDGYGCWWWQKKWWRGRHKNIISLFVLYAWTCWWFIGHFTSLAFLNSVKWQGEFVISKITRIRLYLTKSHRDICNFSGRVGGVRWVIIRRKRRGWRIEMRINDSKVMYPLH